MELKNNKQNKGKTLSSINNSMVVQETLSNIFNEIINNNQLKIILSKFSEIIKEIYWSYCDKNDYGKMSFQKFYAFYKNFELFPDLINFIQLKCLFCFLSEKSQNFLEPKVKKDGKYLLDDDDFNLEDNNYIIYEDFIYSLSITSILFDFDSKYNEIDKLFFLVQKMNNSAGLKKFQQNKARTYTQNTDFINFLFEMKKKYPNILGQYESSGNNYSYGDFYGINYDSKKNNNTTTNFNLAKNGKTKILNLDNIYDDEQ